MQGERQDQSEFTIERGQERDADAKRTAPRGASSAPRGERPAGQAEFDLGSANEGRAGSGMPERLRRKYYVAEAGAGDEAKVYADPRGEYLAFKVSTDRMATRLEDAGVVRDMVSVAQHRNWKDFELRGSVEFRRTAWLEASVRGISVRGYEPDPVDRAALAFRAKPDVHPRRTAEHSQASEARASETMTVDGVATRRPIDVTVIPPEGRDARTPLRHQMDEAVRRSWNATGKEPPASLAGHARENSAERPTITIELTSSEAGASRQSQRDQWQARADRFRKGGEGKTSGDDACRTARSQLSAIERALAKAVGDPALRRSIVDFARERIAQQIERGFKFRHAEIRQRDNVVRARQRDETTPSSRRAGHSQER